MSRLTHRLGLSGGRGQGTADLEVDASGSNNQREAVLYLKNRLEEGKSLRKK